MTTWPDAEGATFAAAHTIDDDPDHLRCADPRCGEVYANTRAALWEHLEQQHNVRPDTTW
jgi:hypothetical protein